LGIQPTEIRCVFVRTPQIDFSSREIRARIQQKQSIRYMVTDEVRQWIDSKKLYGALDSTFEATRDDREGESPE
jgi:nicotinic acid mononucleotide adenylyltransferase